MARVIHTKGYQGYAVEYSPFFENRLACASSANFGIVGNGRLWIFNTHAPPSAEVEKVFDTQDGLFDLAWSELHENQLVTSSGDGSIKLWDVSLPDFPVRNWAEHKREVFSVNWNLVRKDTFVTGSWDHSIKLWSPESPVSLQTWQEHTHCIYQTVWSPSSPDIFASASGDQLVKTWDVRSPRSTLTFRAHANEVLALDWNKYDPSMVVTGSVDHTIKAWDLRNTTREVALLRGHDYAVRRVKCSPHSRDVVASVSYDMSARWWNISVPHNQLIHVHDRHTEFVLGLDMSMFYPGRVATCAWDEMVHEFDVPAMMGAK
ncbi:WD40-repeat-containing domain protein [Zopfochytrium polystomum]|nr:WD40-repeat-containing domain protein [Zopfochytrium polystomum]